MLNYWPSKWDIGILGVWEYEYLSSLSWENYEKKIRRQWCPDKFDQENMIPCFGLASIELIMEVSLFSEKQGWQILYCFSSCFGELEAVLLFQLFNFLPLLSNEMWWDVQTELFVCVHLSTHVFTQEF